MTIIITIIIEIIIRIITTVTSNYNNISIPTHSHLYPLLSSLPIVAVFVFRISVSSDHRYKTKQKTHIRRREGMSECAVRKGKKKSMKRGGERNLSNCDYLFIGVLFVLPVCCVYIVAFIRSIVIVIAVYPAIMVVVVVIIVGVVAVVVIVIVIS